MDNNDEKQALTSSACRVRPRNKSGVYAKRYDGQQGEIIDFGIFHGMESYRVRFADGEELWWDPEEIERL